MSKNGTSKKPSPNGTNGRTKTGQFAPGNKFGRGGSVHAQRKSQFRAMLMESVTDEDFLEIVKVLLGEAKAGKMWAIKELLDRLVGKPDQKIDVDGTFTLADALARLPEVVLDRR